MFEVKELNIVKEIIPPDTSDLQRIFFDIEGSLTVTGDVIQLAYIVTDWDFNIIQSYRKYFRNHVPITNEEYEVHKLSEAFLWENATCHFSVELPNLDVFRRQYSMYIAFTDFDLRKLVEQCTKHSLPPMDFGPRAVSLKTIPRTRNNFDAYSIKGRSLAQSATKEQKNEVAAVTQGRAHDAMYDTYLTYVLCRDYFKTMP
jgi:hypothetical protein